MALAQGAVATMPLHVGGNNNDTSVLVVELGNFFKNMGQGQGRRNV